MQNSAIQLLRNPLRRNFSFGISPANPTHLVRRIKVISAKLSLKAANPGFYNTRILWVGHMKSSGSLDACPGKRCRSISTATFLQQDEVFLQ